MYFYIKPDIQIHRIMIEINIQNNSEKLLCYGQVNNEYEDFLTLEKNYDKLTVNELRRYNLLEKKYRELSNNNSIFFKKKQY